MYLHHFTKPKISEYDTLTSEEKWNDCYDVILANPPFMTPKGGIVPHSRYRVKAKRSEVLFVDYIAEHLNPTGRAAIIVPEGIVFQSANAYKELRKYLVDDGLLYAVISLPAGVFNPYSGVKTSILLIDKSFARLKDEILFVKLNNDGFDLGAQRQPKKGSEIPEIVRIVKKYHADLDPQIADDEILQHPLVTIAPKEQIAEQDYVLVGERYLSNSMPEGKYKMVSLGDKSLFRVESGGTPSSNIPEYWDGNIRWATLVDLPAANLITELKDTERTISPLGLEKSSAKLLPSGTVLVSTRATIGRVAIAECETATNQGFKNIIVIDDTKVSNRFVAYMMTALADRMVSLASGGTFKEISKSNFLTLSIPLPPLEKQEQIVAELDSHQKIIDGARQVVENYKPTIQNNSHWKTVRLGDICELNPRKSEVKDFEGNVSFVPMAMVSETDMYFSVQEQKPLKEVYTGYTYFRDDDVLLAKVTPCFENGKSGLAKKLENGIGFGSSEFFVLRATPEKVLPEYIYYIINSNRFISEGTPQMTGTGGLRRLTKDFVLNYPVSLPPLDEQRKIVNQTEEEIAIVEQNKRLIEIFEKKINDKISEVWGE